LVPSGIKSGARTYGVLARCRGLSAAAELSRMFHSRHQRPSRVPAFHAAAAVRAAARRVLSRRTVLHTAVARDPKGLVDHSAPFSNRRWAVGGSSGSVLITIHSAGR